MQQPMNHSQADPRSDTRWLAPLFVANAPQDLRDALQATSLSVENLRSITIVGSAGEGQRLVRICANNNIKVDAIVDDDASKVGSVIEGLSVQTTMRLHPYRKQPLSCRFASRTQRQQTAPRSRL
jgi:FlaA1/EpsC-like NDP-sugar epimerase